MAQATDGATFRRGSVVGALATLVDIGALSLLVWLGVAARAASIPALVLGVVVQFLGSKLFTFRETPDRETAYRESKDSRWGAEAALFVVVELGALVLNAFVFDVAVRVAAPGAAALPLLRLVTTSAVYFGFSLPLWSLVFRRRPRGETP